MFESVTRDEIGLLTSKMLLGELLNIPNSSKRLQETIDRVELDVKLYSSKLQRPLPINESNNWKILTYLFIIERVDTLKKFKYSQHLTPIKKKYEMKLKKLKHDYPEEFI